MIDRSEFLRSYRSLASADSVQRFQLPGRSLEQLQYLFATVDGMSYTLTCPVVFRLHLN